MNTKTYAKSLGINFKASNGWVEKFMSRHELSTRSKTSCQQKIPEDYVSSSTIADCVFGKLI